MSCNYNEKILAEIRDLEAAERVLTGLLDENVEELELSDALTTAIKTVDKALTWAKRRKKNNEDLAVSRILASRGYTNAEIADILGINEAVVRNNTRCVVVGG